MKKVKLFALFVILIAVVANGSPRRWMPTGGICDESFDPSLCPGGVNTGLCTNFCANDSTCQDGFHNITAGCTSGFCICHGIPNG